MRVHPDADASQSYSIKANQTMNGSFLSRCLGCIKARDLFGQHYVMGLDQKNFAA